VDQSRDIGINLYAATPRSTTDFLRKIEIKCKINVEIFTISRWQTRQ